MIVLVIIFLFILFSKEGQKDYRTTSSKAKPLANGEEYADAIERYVSGK